MDPTQQRQGVARGARRWQAARLTPQVKKRGITKRKKQGKNSVEREMAQIEKTIAAEAAKERSEAGYIPDRG